MTKKTKSEDSNLMYSLVEGSEYVKNPLGYAQLRGNMSRVQASVYIGVLDYMQPRIAKVLDMRKAIRDGKIPAGTQLSLFSQDELRQQLITIEMPLRDLNISTKDMKQVQETLENMTSASYTYRTTDENGVSKIESIRMFTKAGIEGRQMKDGRMTCSKVYVDVVLEAWDRLMNTDHGYTRHLKNIVPMCRNVKTSRLYIFLSALNYKMRNGTADIPYDDVREFLGAMPYEKDGKIVNKYPRYANLKRDVLDPIKEEMKQLADSGNIEFCFDYEAHRPNGKQRGEPDFIRFWLVAPEHGSVELIGNSPTLPAASAEMWHKFLSLAAERVGADVMAKYDGAYWMENMTDTQVVIGAANKVVLPLLTANIFTPCADIFREIFGDRTGEFTVK